MSLRFRLSLAVLALSVLALAAPAASSATMPGLNGRIAFESTVPLSEVDYSTSLWSLSPDGSGAVQLTAGPEDHEAVYSPDGARLAFMKRETLWVAAADGSAARVLVPTVDVHSKPVRWQQNYHPPAEPSRTIPWVKIEEELEFRDFKDEPSFSPDGATLAVDHYTGTFFNRVICSTSGNGFTGCTSGSGSYFESESGCEDCGSTIEAISSTTGAPVAVLVPRSNEPFNAMPSFAAGGGLAYVSETGSNDDILYKAAPGAAPVELAKGSQASNPDVSPDGTRVAFSLKDQIGIVPVTGGTPTYVKAPPPAPADTRVSARRPVWSPDGSLIAFGAFGAKEGEMRYSDGAIFLMNADGSSIRAIRGGVVMPTSWQPLPRPLPVMPPAAAVRAHALKGKHKVRLNRKGLAVVGRILCGSTPCQLTSRKAKLKLGGKKIGVKAVIPGSLLPGAAAPVKVKLRRKALGKLMNAGGGHLSLAVAVTDAAGSERLSFAPKLLPPAPKHGHKGHGRAPR